MMRKIALLDLDAFFASCEILKNPALKDIPFAVGGSSPRAVVSTCNYLARAFGVKSAMPVHQALKLCPHLTLVSGNMGFYKEISAQIYDILQSYELTIEPASIDEFYIDLTENKRFQGSANLTIEAIRRDISQLGITASAGISNQKMVAKIASDENKPNGQFTVLPHEVKDYIAALKLNRIPGIGPKTYEKLKSYGLTHGHHIQNISRRELMNLVGNQWGMRLYDRCQGIDNRSVSTDSRRKSIGVERTFDHNITQLSQALEILEQKLWPSLLLRLEKYDKDKKISGQSIKIKTHDFQITTLSRQSLTCSYDLFVKLFTEAWQRLEGKEVRLLGISTALPQGDKVKQMELNF